MSKAYALEGTLTVSGINYENTSVNLKFEREKIELLFQGGGGWPEQFPKGSKKLTGTMEFPWEDTKIGTGNLPAPMADTLGTFVANVGNKTIAFSAAIYDFDMKKGNQGLVTVTCSFESSGEVTIT
jgi:hypothetical protein